MSNDKKLFSAKQGKHSACRAFLYSVTVEGGRIRRGIQAGVSQVFRRNTGVEKLFPDHGGNIDFVMGRTNAGRDNGNDVPGISLKLVLH